MISYCEIQESNGYPKRVLLALDEEPRLRRKSEREPPAVARIGGAGFPHTLFKVQTRPRAIPLTLFLIRKCVITWFRRCSHEVPQQAVRDRRSRPRHRGRRNVRVHVLQAHPRATSAHHHDWPSALRSAVQPREAHHGHTHYRRTHPLRSELASSGDMGNMARPGSVDTRNAHVPLWRVPSVPLPPNEGNLTIKRAHASRRKASRFRSVRGFSVLKIHLLLLPFSICPTLHVPEKSWNTRSKRLTFPCKDSLARILVPARADLWIVFYRTAQQKCTP